MHILLFEQVVTWIFLYWIGFCTWVRYAASLRIIFLFHERGLFLPCVMCTSDTTHISITFCCILSFRIIEKPCGEPLISFELLFFGQFIDRRNIRLSNIEYVWSVVLLVFIEDTSMSLLFPAFSLIWLMPHCLF